MKLSSVCVECLGSRTLSYQRIVYQKWKFVENIQDVVEFVSSSEQIWWNLALHHLLTTKSHTTDQIRWWYCGYMGLISKNDETAYLDEVERITSWCQDNCLSLNVSKTKITDYELQEETAAALHSS